MFPSSMASTVSRLSLRVDQTRLIKHSGVPHSFKLVFRAAHGINLELPNELHHAVVDRAWECSNGSAWG